MKENKLSHSRLGITSFVLSLIYILGIIVYFFWAEYLTSISVGGAVDDLDLFFWLQFLKTFSFLTGLVGITFGILLVKKEKNNIFGILGTVLSGGFSLLILLLVLFG